MTEQTPEQPEQLPDTEQTGPATDEPRTETDNEGRTLSDPPADVDEATATGYAVYNRTLGQYVAGVEAKRPTSSQASKRVPDGHSAAVVRV